MAGSTNTRSEDLDRSAERALHARLLSEDPVAPSELAQLFLPKLLTRLRRSARTVDPHLVETVAIDSLLHLASRPDRYDPERSSLLAYLHLDALGDLRNLLRKEARQTQRRVPLEVVELSPSGRNLKVGPDNDPATLVVQGMERAALAALYQDFEPADREVVQLMAEGERRTELFAQIIGVSHLAPKEQARAVKKCKDRLLKRLQRRARARQVDG
jgi:RNA polymerase sigma-70 factor, ECF subfamily